jgi:inhibitor of KinA sporulation pathway (predicted exonuclease)
MIGKINIIDMEFECWKNKGTGEIIQIGICQFDCETRSIDGCASFFVGPHKLSQYCLDLTKINYDEYLKKSISLDICVNQLYDKYDLNKRHWVSWGNQDRIKMRSNKIKTGTHMNLRDMYEIKTNLKARSLFASMRHIGITPYGNPHNAIDDAVNCAILLKEILR